MNIDVSEIIRKNRQSRGLSTREIAKMAGLSASMISTIEAGKCSPSLNTLAKIAQALKIELTELVSQASETRIYHKKNVSECPGKKSKDKSFTCYLLSDKSLNRRVELYAFKFTNVGRHESPGHAVGTIEYVVVEEGEMSIEIGGQVQHLKAGDAMEFRAGQPHTYIQESNKLARGTSFHYHG